MVTCDLTERMLAARSAAVISPRNSTSLPTTTEVMTPGYSLVRRDRDRNLREVFQPVAAEPDPLNDLQPHLGGKCRNLIEAVFDRIGAHAFGYLGELRQILGDLFRADMRGRHQRRLVAAERRVGHALQLGVGVDRRARQIDRRGQPPPRRGDRTQGYQEKRQWRTKRNRFHPPGEDRRLACHRPPAKSRIVAIGALPRLRLHHNAIKL